MAALDENEQRAFRHFLGLLMDADEPEAMLGALTRLAELKARRCHNGVITDREAAARWHALAGSLHLAQRILRAPPAQE